MLLLVVGRRRMFGGTDTAVKKIRESLFSMTVRLKTSTTTTRTTKIAAAVALEEEEEEELKRTIMSVGML